MRNPVTGIAALFVLFVVIIVGYGSVFTVAQTEQALVVRLGEPVKVVYRARFEFQGAVHRYRDRHRQAHPRSRKSSQGSDCVGPEAAGGGCLRPLPHQERAAVLSERRLDPGRQHPVDDAC